MTTPELHRLIRLRSLAARARNGHSLTVVNNLASIIEREARTLSKKSEEKLPLTERRGCWPAVKLADDMRENDENIELFIVSLFLGILTAVSIVVAFLFT